MWLNVKYAAIPLWKCTRSATATPGTQFTCCSISQVAHLLQCIGRLQWTWKKKINISDIQVKMRLCKHGNPMFILLTAICAAEINSSPLWQGGWCDSPTVSANSTRVSRWMVVFGVSARAPLAVKTETNISTTSCTMTRKHFSIICSATHQTLHPWVCGMVFETFS